MNDPVRDQYERFPYPPVPLLALPRRGEGAALAYERADGRKHDGIRILVAGAGTLEALVVAQAHPRAAEIVALDVSAHSVAKLRRRVTLRRFIDRLTLRRLPPVRCVRADLREWEGEGKFDYILASNLLHHLPDPAAMLGRLAAMLTDGGIMRVRTYSCQSRIWVRETGRWLRVNGLIPESPNLAGAAKRIVGNLPEGHPLHGAFATHRERHHAAGIVDAFLHARENPLAPLQWRSAAARAGLELIGEGQPEHSRSGFIAELLPATAALDPWQRLQLMDDLLELTANPILWLRKGKTGDGEIPAWLEAPGPRAQETMPAAGTTPERLAESPYGPWRLPSRVHWELGRGLARAARQLDEVGGSLGEALAVLRREVGPRVDHQGRPLTGLSIGEYDEPALTALPRPWDEEEWRTLQRLLGPCWRLRLGEGENEEAPPGTSMAEQAAWLQSRYGTERSWIEPVHLVKW